MKTRYRHEVPLDLYAPLPKEQERKPVEAVVPPANACRCNKVDCIECWNAGVRYADYRKQKKLEEL